MKFLDKIKQFMQNRAEKRAKLDVVKFLFETSPFEDPYPHLKKHKERLAYKRNLTATYTYGSDEDKLSKKQDFIDQYTVNEKQQLSYFTQYLPEERSDFARCKAWRDHEQVERCAAQKAWRVVQHRNHRAHMRQKFMNQKTR